MIEKINPDYYINAALCSDFSASTLPKATMHHLKIKSHGYDVFAVYYQASGPGCHPTVVLLHGLPGFDQNTDIAHSIRRLGWNVIIFHYRGAWGSGGEFTIGNSIEDTEIVLEYLRDSNISKKLCVNIDKIVVVGHSMGGGIAGVIAAKNKYLAGVALISPWNFGRLAGCISENEIAQLKEELQSGEGPLAGATADSIIRDAQINGLKWDTKVNLAKLSNKPVLIVKSNDLFFMDTEEISQLLYDIKYPFLTDEYVDTDHVYSDQRIKLQKIIIKWLLTICQVPADS